MEPRHRDIGVCGLSCRLCPRYHTVGESRCGGCKSESRTAAGCPFITCAVKKRGIEFCWDCGDKDSCTLRAKHRDFRRSHDTFVCYAALDRDIASVERNGLSMFIAEQDRRAGLLEELLGEFNEGRSKSYYCIAASLLDPAELQSAIAEVRLATSGMALKEKSKAMHAKLDGLASGRSIQLALRK